MRILAIIAFLLPLAAGCEQAADRKAFAQSVSPNAVRSEAFGVTVEKPEGWYTLNQEMQDALVNQAAKVVSHGNDALAGKFDVGLPRTSQIFGIFKYEPGAAVESNPSVIAMAENLSLSPGVKTGKDYFFHFRKVAVTGNSQYEFKEESSFTIGGKEFDRLDLTLTLNGQSAEQSYYAARFGEHIILFIQSYKSEQERFETDAIVNSIKFD